MNIVRQYRRLGLFCGLLCVLALAGCPAAGPIDRKNVIPVLPAQVDPPIVQPVTPTGSANVVILTDGMVLDVYINGHKTGTTTAQSGSVTVQVPSSYTTGNYALALVDPSTGEILLTRVLEVP